VLTVLPPCHLRCLSCRLLASAGILLWPLWWGFMSLLRVLRVASGVASGLTELTSSGHSAEGELTMVAVHPDLQVQPCCCMPAPADCSGVTTPGHSVACECVGNALLPSTWH